MAQKLYFSDRECRAAGFSTAMINTLRKIAEFVDAQNQIAELQTDLEANGDAIDTANTSITALNVAVNSLDSRIDAYDALDPFVRQDQAARPAYSTYAGQTVSAAYVQAEAQATDDAVKALATSYATLLTRLDTVNLLT